MQNNTPVNPASPAGSVTNSKLSMTKPNVQNAKGLKNLKDNGDNPASLGGPKQTPPSDGGGGHGQKGGSKSKRLRFKQKHLAFPYGLLVAVFVIIPLVIMLIEAFRGEDGSFTIRNFDKFWAQGEDTANLWRVILNTAWLALLTTAVTLGISYPLALSLCKLKPGVRNILVLLFVAPMWINSLLRIFAVKLMFEGIMQKGFALTLIGMVYDFFPFMLMPVYISLSNMDKALVEAAGDLGASPLRTLIKVKLPLSVPGIVSGVTMVFMPAMSTFAISRILGGTLVLFGNQIEDKMRYGAGSAYSLVLLIIMAVTFFAANKFTKISGNARGEGIL